MASDTWCLFFRVSCKFLSVAASVSAPFNERIVLCTTVPYRSMRDFDEGLYQRCVRACQLESDFADWPEGDRTVIGAKGQKHFLCAPPH